MTDSSNFDILTIGHSNLPADSFINLVKNAGVAAIVDVRSVPFSRRYPWFSSRTLSDRLQGRGIAYVALGASLGGRPATLGLYRGGVADYEKMAETAVFRAGLDRVMEEASRHRVCLMCAEREPLDCHRCLLVGRVLARRGCAVGHILGDGRIETQTATEDRLLARAGAAIDLFGDRSSRLNDAYRWRARTVAAKLADRVRPGRTPPAFMAS